MEYTELQIEILIQVQGANFAQPQTGIQSDQNIQTFFESAGQYDSHSRFFHNTLLRTC